MIYNTCIFVGIAIYGHPNHTTDIIIEFTLKNSSRWYITLAYLPVLPYMVTPITKWTLTKSKVPLHSMHMESTGTPWGVIRTRGGVLVKSMQNPWDYWDSITTEFSLKNAAWWWPYHILSKYSLQMIESPSRLSSHQKMVLGDDHIIDYQNMVSGWHSHHHDWILTEKWC